MLKQEILMSILRFYPSDDDKEYLDYSAVCNLVWESPSVVWIKGLQGKMTRKSWRELLRFMIDNNVHTIKVFRSPSHSLPLGEYKTKDYAELNVQTLANRFMREPNG